MRARALISLELPPFLRDLRPPDCAPAAVLPDDAVGPLLQNSLAC